MTTRIPQAHSTAIATQPNQRSASADSPARLNRLQRHWTKLVLGYLLTAGAAFIALAAYVRAVPSNAFDLAFTQWVQSFDAWWFDGLMRVISILGFDWKAIAIISLITLFLFCCKLRREAILALVGTTGIWVLDNAAKAVVLRPRPSPELVHVINHLDGPSFTSGHVTSFTVFYGYLWFLSYTRMEPSWRRTALLTLFSVLIVLIGLSRVYSGEHWFSDVIGSYLLGSLWLAVVIYLYRLWRPKETACSECEPAQESPEQGAIAPNSRL